MALSNDEKKLLYDIARKHDIEPEYLEELISIEKEYADKNMSRRRGIYTKISELIMEWIKEEERNNR